MTPHELLQRISSDPQLMILTQINPIFREAVTSIVESDEDDVAALLLAGLVDACNQAAHYRDEVTHRPRRGLPSFFAFRA